MLPLDFHAHIQPTIDSGNLDQLEACVVAVTRTTEEYESALKRHHAATVWGVGAHPGVPRAHERFDQDKFRELVSQTPVIGEVGLDGRSEVDLSLQLRTLRDILEIATKQPRLISIHSSFASAPILSTLEGSNPKGVVLHWWRGNKGQTIRALDLGCYFSLNFAETVRPKVLQLLPRNRVLTETDHPFGDRHQAEPGRPGLVLEVEKCLAQHWDTSIEAVRHQVWTNLLAIASETQTLEMLPATFQRNLLAL